MQLNNETVLLIVIGFTIIIALLVLVVSIYTLQILKVIIRKQEVARAESKGVPVPVEAPGLWSQLMEQLTRRAPVEKEQDILKEHSYDGIRELDNHLPPWWKWLFYISIIWGAVYLVVYHVTDSLPLQDEEYQNQMARAQEQIDAYRASLQTEGEEGGGEILDETTVTFAGGDAELADGMNVFNIQCSPCHRTDGGGGIGPNLTDNFWLHGNTVQDIFKIIRVGVPEKGMIAWEGVITPDQMRNVSSYIMTMVGTDPPDAKGPQGEELEPVVFE